ncbi:MAG TPA: hypothetical protein VIF09_25710 [Polyangiaceae bacterium]
MTTTRASKPSRGPSTGGVARVLAWALGVALVAGCGGTQPTLEAPAASSSSPPPRRPDAVVLEPPAAMPAVVPRAEAHGVVALREPPGADAIREIVQQLADAWEHASLEGLIALLTPDAGVLDARARGRGALVESWRQRLHAHEYGRLSGTELLRADRVERWTWDELGASDAPPRPADMKPDEIYLRVPVEVTHLQNEKLFDDVIVLVVRLEDGRYRISQYGEIELP